jgi:hypothetical protein
MQFVDDARVVDFQEQVLSFSATPRMVMLPELFNFVSPDFLAQAGKSSVDDVQRSYGNIIFMGVFFLALIFAAIWWLRR